MKSTTCPKCKHVNKTENQAECPKCGIIYTRYQARVKKDLKQAFIDIGDFGFDSMKDIFTNLVKKHPSLKPICESYYKAISVALKKHETNEQETAEKIFQSILEKQPSLGKAIEPYLNREELDPQPSSPDNQEEIPEENSKSALTGIFSVVFLIVTVVNFLMKLYNPGFFTLVLSIVLFGIWNSTRWASTQNKKPFLHQRNTMRVIASVCIAWGIFAIINHEDQRVSSTRTKSYTNTYSPSPSPSSTTTPISYSSPSFSEAAVMILNTEYGNVCHAELSGIFSKTLKIDWTSRTVVIHTMKVFAEIGNAKEQLYNDGVRYFQFPNDAGGYNVIDWKTGDKKSISERAPYYFN